MPDCGYCDAAFDDEAAYLDHLSEAHADELGPIDRRRVATDSSGSLPTGPIAIAIVVLALVAVVGYGVSLSGGGGAADAGSGSNDDGPYDLWGVHYHGTMLLVVDGESVDFSRPPYQLQADAFHFEDNDGTRWHVHARGVTLAWAMETLGIPTTADTITFDGTTYDDADAETTVSVTVNGDPVEPAAYVLRDGDAVRIVVDIE